MTLKTKEDIKEIVNRSLNNILKDCDDYFGTSSFIDIGMDSLDMIEFIMSIEESFDIDLDDDFILNNIKTIDDFVDLIKNPK